MILDDQQAARDTLNGTNDSTKRMNEEISRVETATINVLKRWSRKIPPRWEASIDVQSMMCNISIINSMMCNSIINISEKMDPEIQKLFKERQQKLSKVANALHQSLIQERRASVKISIFLSLIFNTF